MHPHLYRYKSSQLSNPHYHNYRYVVVTAFLCGLGIYAVVDGHISYAILTIALLTVPSMIGTRLSSHNEEKMPDNQYESQISKLEIGASEQRFKALIENGSDLITVVSSNGTLQYVSPSVKKILGYHSDETIGTNVFEYIHPADLPQVKDHFLKLLENARVPSTVRIRFRHADGTYRTLEAKGANQLANSHINGVVINSRDVTEQQRDQEHIARQLQRLNALRIIDNLINAGFELPDILPGFLDQVIALLQVDAAAISLCPMTFSSRQYSAQNCFRKELPDYLSLYWNEGVAGQAVRERKRVICNNLSEYAQSSSDIAMLINEGFVTCIALPLMAKHEVKGVLQLYHRSPLEVDEDWLDFLETLGGQAAIAINDAALFDGLQNFNQELIQAYSATIEGWSRALDLRDKETEGHTQRVTALTMHLARAAGMSEAEIVHVRYGALLHDIGKMGVPDSILLKPGPLTDEEWTIMRLHPRYAYEMLAPIQFLKEAIVIPYCHHEKWDGTGYPLGLKGEEIPLAARLFAVVDVWDALRSDRPYRQGWPEHKVRQHIQSLSGTHFDPYAVELFLKITAADGIADDSVYLTAS